MLLITDEARSDTFTAEDTGKRCQLIFTVQTQLVTGLTSGALILPLLQHWC